VPYPVGVEDLFHRVSTTTLSAAKSDAYRIVADRASNFSALTPRTTHVFAVEHPIPFSLSVVHDSSHRTTITW